MKKNTTGVTQATTTQQRELIDSSYVPPMDISVRIHSMQPEGATRARLSLNFGGVFAVRGVRLINGQNGYFLSMPSYKVGENYKDVCFSFDDKFTQYMTNRVVQDYHQALEQTHQASQSHAGQQAAAPGHEAGQQMAGM